MCSNFHNDSLNFHFATLAKVVCICVFIFCSLCHFGCKYLNFWACPYAKCVKIFYACKWLLVYVFIRYIYMPIFLGAFIFMLACACCRTNVCRFLKLLVFILLFEGAGCCVYVWRCLLYSSHLQMFDIVFQFEGVCNRLHVCRCLI